MDKVIQFIANYDDWVAIKKLKVDEHVGPRTVVEFLAGLGTGIDAKIEQNLGREVEIVKLDNALGEALADVSGKGEGAIAKALAAANSRAVGGVINEITAKPELQKNEQKELRQFCKVYALRKALKEIGLEIDYSNVDIPGMKKLKRAKV